MVVDYYSRFLEVAVLKSTTSAKIIEAITPMMLNIYEIIHISTGVVDESEE